VDVQGTALNIGSFQRANDVPSVEDLSLVRIGLGSVAVSATTVALGQFLILRSFMDPPKLNKRSAQALVHKWRWGRISPSITDNAKLKLNAQGRWHAGLSINSIW
jgi:hypothetical protein